MKKNGLERMPGLLLVNELAVMDIKQWIADSSYDISIWKNIMFQIVSGIYCMENVFGVQHNDLHHANILIHNVS